MAREGFLDWDAVGDEAVALLRDLVRFDTSNPPGNEMPAARHVASVLASAGYDPVVLESAPGRGSVVARLEGEGRGGPLLLLGHLDVVPAEPDRWSRPPFGAVEAGGVLWGRGSLDMKYVVATQIATMLALRRAGFRPGRDVVLAAVADEETGGALGVRWILDKHPELLEAEYALGEFGGFPMEMGGRRFYWCQTAEKGIAWLRMRTRGRPGHGSMPHSDSSVVRMGEAVAMLGARATPIHISQTARAMIEGMAKADPRLLGLLEQETSQAVLASLPPGQALMLGAIIRNTVSVTGLKAGYRHNVIPGTAEAMIDCRLVPGQTPRDVEREILEITGGGIEFEEDMVYLPVESRFDTPLFEAMSRHIEAYDPGAEAMPMLLVGGTDGRFLVRRGTIYYGYSPIKLPAELRFMELVHGHDERIPIEAFREGVRVFIETVMDFCAR